MIDILMVLLNDVLSNSNFNQKRIMSVTVDDYRKLVCTNLQIRVKYK